MTTQQRFFLGKDDRLKSRKIIDLLFAHGKSFSNFPFKVIWQPADTLQIGIGVSSRHFRKATDRNRIKRLVREAWRKQKQELHTKPGSGVSVFLLYYGNEVPEYELVHEKITSVIKRLIKFINEKNQEDT